MFWIALAALIMALTGAGDDTADVRRQFDLLANNVNVEVADEGRRARALGVIELGRKSFFRHRGRLAVSGRCIEKLDRTYAVTREEYLACLEDQPLVWDAFVTEYNTLNRDLQASLLPEEAARIRGKMAQ